MQINKFFNLLKKSFLSWYNHKVSNLAASLSFYMLFSFPPLMIICITIAGFALGSDVAEQQIFLQLTSVFGEDTAEQIKIMVLGAARPLGGFFASITGILIIIISATGFFSQLQDGINTIWEIKPKGKQSLIYIFKERFFSVMAVLGVAFLLLVSLIINTVIMSWSSYMQSMLPAGGMIWIILNSFISLIIIGILFSFIFKIFPNENLHWHDVWLGGFLTSFLFMLGKFILEIYLAHVNMGSLYGSASSLIVILIWIYYSCQILFFGVEFTKIQFKHRKEIH